jgi:hypothetical protein
VPQIDLKTNKSSRKSTKTPSNDPFQSRTPWPSPWGDDFGDFGGDRPDQVSRMTPQERVSMIEKVYEEVLGRKPDTRDINYYKYSTLTEDEIRRQLLSGKEHKQLVEDGREFKKMRERATAAETKIKMLEAQNQDQLEEFKHLTKLLKEKNVYIQEMRQKLNNPYNFVGKDNPNVTTPAPTSMQAPIEPTSNEKANRIDTIFTTPQSSASSENKSPSIFDRIKNVITP